MSDHTSLKRCTKCLSEYPATLEYFPKNNRNKSGLQSRCILCTKVCILEYSKKYREFHRDIMNARSRRWRKNNPDKVKANNARWKELDPNYGKRYYRAHKEHVLARCKAYKRANRDAIRKRDQMYRQLHSDQARERQRVWYRNSREKARAKWHRYYAYKRKLPTNLTSGEWESCLRYFNFSCVYCGNPQGLLEFTKLTLDHFMPVSNAATNNPGTSAHNVVPACKSCNSSKSDRDPVEWLTEKVGARKAKKILARIHAYFDSLKDGDS